MSGDERRLRLRDARLYLCTDSRKEQGDLEEFLEAVLAAGVDVVQLREKGLEARDEIELAEVFGLVTRRHGALFSINDRADIAWISRPDVLHLGQNDLPVPAARAILGDDVVIGRSTHAPHAVDMALASGVDYFCVGPVWAPDEHPAPGLQLVTYAAGRAPAGSAWFAMGGIDVDNLDAVIDAGATRVVVDRAVTQADDPAAVVEELAGRLRG
ncbi:MAG: thiamine-phosphate pyrophosphorylase [Frankiaceae bacterium]|jgi:thiamine-phosphate pyrophosphorylase|nr:thiamine-phosphate pyrophosphorylase [Frankiaceae bacterium]